MSQWIEVMAEFEYSIIPINSIIDDKELASFTCGSHEEEIKINEFIKFESENLDYRGINKSFLYYRGEELVGFFSLCTSETTVTKQYRRKKFKMINNSLKVYPSIELSYFAIKDGEQKNHLGTAMMLSVIEMLYYNVFMYVGFIIVTVESRNSTKGFYEKMGFSFHKTKSGHDNLMALTITDIEAILGFNK